MIAIPPLQAKGCPQEPAETAPTQGVVEPLANGQSFSGRKLRLVAANPVDANPAGTVERPVAGVLELEDQ